MATRTNIDHQYSRSVLKKIRVKRRPSIFSGEAGDHEYSKIYVMETPPKTKRKRDQSPLPPLELCTSDKQKSKTNWSEEEKEFIKEYVERIPRGQESLTEYWKQCAVNLNINFQHTSRNGHACKSCAQRICIAPSSLSPDPCSQHDANTQAGISLPVDCIREKSRRVDLVDLVCIEPKKELKECASPAANTVHHTATKRLKEYPPLTDTEKLCLIDVITNGTPKQIATAAMRITSLEEEIKHIVMSITLSNTSKDKHPNPSHAVR